MNRFNGCTSVLDLFTPRVIQPRIIHPNFFLKNQLPDDSAPRMIHPWIIHPKDYSCPRMIRKEKDCTIAFLTLELGNYIFSWRSAIGRPTKPLHTSYLLQFFSFEELVNVEHTPLRFVPGGKINILTRVWF